VRVVVAAVVVASAIATSAVAAPNGSFNPDATAHTSAIAAPAANRAPQVSAVLASIQHADPAALPSYLAGNKQQIMSTLAVPGVASQVGSWWNSLGQTQRRSIERNAPALLGNLSGIPMTVRDTANQSVLRRQLDETRRKIRSAGASAKLTATLDGLRSVASALRSPAGAPKRTLTTFDTTGPMRAAIAIGDVDHADDVSILVPGMFYTVSGQMADWTHTAQVLYDTQRAWLKRLGQSNKTVATVAWLGYRTPDLMSVLSLADARDGATMLEEAIAGIRAARGTHQPYLSIVAHSYGSTAALLAAQNGDTELDALAVVGSPGSVATSVHELNVPADRVFVGAALLDPIAGSGYFGTDPGSRDYGARPFGAVGGIDPIDGSVMLPAFGHNGYFAPGTESLRNLALITIGDCSLVTR
jgi:hypothetical protein